MKPELPGPLLLIAGRLPGQARPLAETVAAALRGLGPLPGWLLLREKALPDAALAALIAELLPIVRGAGARLSLSGRPALARRCGLDAVHLPRGEPIGAARAALGRDGLIGSSAHSLAEAVAAARDGADYVTLSPVFPSASKPGYGPPLGLAALGAAARGPAGGWLPIPVVALGGVTAANAGPCLAAGAAGVAVLGGVMGAADPAAAVAALAAALGSHQRMPAGRPGDGPPPAEDGQPMLQAARGQSA